MAWGARNLISTQVDGNTKSIISHGLGHGVLHYLSVTQGGLSRSEPLITRATPWYVAAGLLLSSFGLFFDLLERTEFPPWLKTTQAVASALLVPTTVPLIMARFRVLRGVFASPARAAPRHRRDVVRDSSP